MHAIAARGKSTCCRGTCATGSQKRATAAFVALSILNKKASFYLW
jgi:hypothetical protein